MAKRKVPLDVYKKYAENHTREEIAKHFNVSKNYVDSMRYHFGITCKKKDDVPRLAKDMTHEQFIKFCTTHTYAEIKEKFHTGNSSPYLWEERYGFKIKETPNPTELADRNLDIYKRSKKQSQYSLAKEFNISRQRVHSIVETYKKKEERGEL